MDDKLTRTRLRLDPRKFAGAANRNRTPGLHLTDVLRDIDGVLGRVYKNDLTEDDLNDMALQGYLWEWAMTETLVDRVVGSSGEAIGEELSYIRLPEIAVALDGSRAMYVGADLPAAIRTVLTRGMIIMSPDGGVLRPEARLSLLECKFCYKSARMEPSKDKPQWFHQAKAYLLGWSLVERRFIGDVEWHVQFPVGERWGDAAVYERWSRQYEQAEISATWAMVRAHVDWRLSAAGGGDPYNWRQWL